MKIQGQLLDTMRAAMKAAAEHYGVDTFKAKYAEAGLSENRMLFDLWHVAEDNLQYNDDHPGFKSGNWPRVYPHQPGFSIYNDRSIKDAHILTAIRMIGKELGLI